MNHGIGNVKGEKGADGVSPIVSVEAITGGYEITITDANGTQTFTVMNGQNGTNGQDGITPSINVVASVDNSVGTPSVSVVKSGTDANPTFTFSFQNLKGETGTSLIQVEVVSNLPASGDTGKLYFLSNSGSAPNQYDEYIWLNNAWEKLGTQNIDLSNYIQKSNTSGLVKNDGTIDTNTYLTNNSNLLLSKIVDSQGHNRFLEGDGTPLSATGINITYCKWALSGTHLMFVVAGDVENGATLPNNSEFGIFSLPQWIMDKIYPVWDNRFLEIKTVTFTASDWSIQTKDSVLNKYSGAIRISNPSSVALTFTKARGFRIQYDLLIDTD